MRQHMDDNKPYPTGLAGRLDPICDRFETEWKQGRRPRLEDSLSEAEESDRPVLVRDLVSIEIHHRTRLGEQPQGEEYCTRLPKQYWSAIAAAFADLPTSPGAPPSPLAASSVPLIADAKPVLVSRYRIMEPIGKGGQGVVYRALDPNGRPVAVKRSKTGHESLRQEARQAASLSHPNIVPLLELVEESGVCWLIYQFIDGESLAQRLRHELQNRLAPERAVPIAAALADALVAAHAKLIYHRDVKPGNILLDKSGRPYLADFGLAVHEDQLAVACPGGTRIYMPPEQFLQGHINDKADIYSLGATLYEMLGGRAPVQVAPSLRPTREQLGKLVTEHNPAPLSQFIPEIPRELNDLCARCLARNPEVRPTARELRNALRAWVNARSRRSFLRYVMGVAAIFLAGDDPELYYPQTEPPRRRSSVARPGPLLEGFLKTNYGIIPGAKNQQRLEQGKPMEMSPYVRAAFEAMRGVCEAKPHTGIAVDFDDPNLAVHLDDEAAHLVEANLMCLGGPVSNPLFGRLNGYVYRSNNGIKLPVFSDANPIRLAFHCGFPDYGHFDGKLRTALRYDEHGALKHHKLFGLIKDKTLSMPGVDDEGLLKEDYLIVTRRPHPDYPEEKRIISIGGMHGYCLEAFAEGMEGAFNIIDTQVELKGFDCFQLLVPAKLEHQHQQKKPRTVAHLCWDRMEWFHLSETARDWRT